MQHKQLKIRRIDVDTIKRATSVDLDEVVHCEPPHQDLRFLKIQLYLSLVYGEHERQCVADSTFQVKYTKAVSSFSLHTFLTLA